MQYLKHSSMACASWQHSLLCFVDFQTLIHFNTQDQKSSETGCVSIAYSIPINTTIIPSASRGLSAAYLCVICVMAMTLFPPCSRGGASSQLCVICVRFWCSSDMPPLQSPNSQQPNGVCCVNGCEMLCWPSFSPRRTNKWTVSVCSVYSDGCEMLCWPFFSPRRSSKWTVCVLCVQTVVRCSVGPLAAPGERDERGGPGTAGPGGGAAGGGGRGPGGRRVLCRRGRGLVQPAQLS